MKLGSTAALVIVLTCAGCGQKMTYEQQLDSAAGVERVQGIMTVGERKIWSAIPRLIEFLEDRDVSVRLAAVRTLREMTGKEFGYVAHADEHERREAANRWKAGWESEGRTGGT